MLIKTCQPIKELVEEEAVEQERSTSFIINSILKDHYGVRGKKKKK